MTERNYFGTDGIRGRVGEEPITAEFALRLGRAAGSVLRSQHATRPRVLIGKDTRLSGYMLESALEAGLAAAGADVVLLGPMPTPVQAFLTRSQRAQAGVVISASHNPYEDNGIVLLADGELDDARGDGDRGRHRCARAMAPPRDSGQGHAHAGCQWPPSIEFLKSRLDSELAALVGTHVVIDAAHGAGYKIAPRLFEELGMHVGAIGVTPNGYNINAGFGATDLTALRAEVTRTGAAIGFALDGDADRLMALTADGRLVDGDDMVYILARHWKARGNAARAGGRHGDDQSGHRVGLAAIWASSSNALPLATAMCTSACASWTAFWAAKPRGM